MLLDARWWRSKPLYRIDEPANGAVLPVPWGGTHRAADAGAFRIAVQVEGLEPGLGDGTSKRIAEQAAARALMEREGIGASADAGPTETA